MGVRGDLRLLETAIRRRFAVDTEKAARQVNDLMESDDHRVRVRALQLAALMESMNQKDEHKVIDVRVSTRHDQLVEIAADLGIEVGAIENASRSAGGSDASAASRLVDTGDGE